MLRFPRLQASTNPLVKALAVIVPAVVLTGAVLMGAVLATALIGLSLLIALVLAGRVWWFRLRGRRVARPDRPDPRAPIEAEYRVIEGGEDRGQKSS